MVVNDANQIADAGFAMLISANITSGGMGKKDDSAKLKPPKNHGALSCRDHCITRRYKDENKRITSPHPTREQNSPLQASQYHGYLQSL